GAMKPKPLSLLNHFTVPFERIVLVSEPGVGAGAGMDRRVDGRPLSATVDPYDAVFAPARPERGPAPPHEAHGGAREPPFRASPEAARTRACGARPAPDVQRDDAGARRRARTGARADARRTPTATT